MDRIGERVGPFQLVEWIRSDEGISLYRGVRPETSRNPRQVALRLPDDADDAESAERLRREYDLLREMDDPRVPRAFGWYSGQSALAFTWIDGVSLVEVLRAWAHRLVPHDPATGLDVVIEVAHALRHLHSLGGENPPVLGNLTPDHVQICTDGRVFLVGFGATAGTHPRCYAAPERVAGAFQDVRTDQWDLGALLVEVLTGERLGPEDALPTRIGPNNPLHRIGRRWPQLGDVLMRMLAPAAGDRFPNDSELVRQLLIAARAVSGTPDRARLAGQVHEVLHRLRKPRATDGLLDPEEQASLERGMSEPPTPVSPVQPADDDVAVPVEVSFDPDSEPRPTADWRSPAGPTIVPQATPPAARPPRRVEPPPEEHFVAPSFDLTDPGAARAPEPFEPSFDQDGVGADEVPLDPSATAAHPVPLSFDGRSVAGVDPVEVAYDPDSAPAVASRANSVAVADDDEVSPDDATQPALTMPIVRGPGSDDDAEPSPHRVPRFQLSEILGMAMGVLLIVVGVLYLFVKIW